MLDIRKIFDPQMWRAQICLYAIAMFAANGSTVHCVETVLDKQVAEASGHTHVRTHTSFIS